MTHVARIELSNWFRFRRASIALSQRAYAVEAELDGDAGRSNWLGKTALVEAIPFALYGSHRFQEGDRAPGFEDAWITEGEKSGSVAIVLSDGSRIQRTRFAGSSTACTFQSPDMCSPASGERAQEAIVALVGLSLDDYFSTAHVRQKACSQLVSAKPAARMDLIAAWLGFAKLDDAGKTIGVRLTNFAKERDRLGAKLTDLRVRLRDLGDEEHFGRRLGGVEDPLGFEAEVKARVGEAERRVRELFEAHAEWTRWKGGDAARERAVAAARRLAQEEANLAQMPVAPGIAPDLVAFGSAHRAASEKAKRALAVARGEFDGRCPVRSGFECPARSEINDGSSGTMAALNAAVDERNRAQKDFADAQAEDGRIRYDANIRQHQVERIGLLRSQAAGPNIDVRSAPREVTSADVQLAEAGIRAGHVQLAALARSLADLARLRVEVSRTEVELADVERRLTVARAARLVLGRGGAQRRIAESACEAIARGANQRLSVRGIDLRIGLSWRREGAEQAPSCDACGNAYPRTRTAKVCERCGSPRGRAVQDRLDVSLSDRSGAAEDLAGLALQRAACAFLRRRRGAGWSTLVLDEPFGALDERHREAVARSLAAVREEDGVEQLLVVAHQPGVLETLPGRILIRASGGENQVEVIE